MTGVATAAAAMPIAVASVYAARCRILNLFTVVSQVGSVTLRVLGWGKVNCRRHALKEERGRDKDERARELQLAREIQFEHIDPDHQTIMCLWIFSPVHVSRTGVERIAPRNSGLCPAHQTAITGGG